MRTQLPASGLTTRSWLRADKQDRGSWPWHTSRWADAAIKVASAEHRGVSSCCKASSPIIRNIWLVLITSVSDPTYNDNILLVKMGEYNVWFNNWYRLYEHMRIHTGEQHSQRTEHNFTDNGWHDPNIFVNNNTRTLNRVILWKTHCMCADSCKALQTILRISKCICKEMCEGSWHINYMALQAVMIAQQNWSISVIYDSKIWRIVSLHLFHKHQENIAV
jgi:hypothetical protein